MAQAVTINLETSREKARKAFETVRVADRKLRDAHISALSDYYTFALDCFQNDEAFQKMCVDEGVKKGHEDASPFLRIVKLVYGGKDASSRQLLSKYAKVLEYAKYHHVTASTITDWLKKMSMEQRLNDARGDIKYLEEMGRDPDAAAIREQFSKALQSAESKTKGVLGSASITIDMDAEGAPTAGYHNLAVKVANDGSVEIVGFTNESEKAVKRSIRRLYKSKKEPKVPWTDIHPLGDLLKSISILSGSVASSARVTKTKKAVKATPAYFSFRNGVKNCTVLVSQLGVSSAPIAKAIIPAIEGFPTGTFVLTPENAKEFFNLCKANRESGPVISDGSGLAVVDELKISGVMRYRHIWTHAHAITVAETDIRLFTRSSTTEGNRLDFIPDENAQTIDLDNDALKTWIPVEGFYRVGTKNNKVNFAGNGTLIKVGDFKKAFTKLKRVGVNMTVTISTNYVLISAGDYEVVIPAILKQDTAEGVKKGHYSPESFTKARW